MATIVIFGARGRTGSAVVAEAGARGIQALAFDKKNPTIEELRRAIRGADVVIVTFGPRPPYTNIFCEEATRNIIRAMEVEGVSRLICVTGAMIGNYPRNRSLAFKLLCLAFRATSPKGYKDRVKQEEVIKNSAIEWTIVKPPRLSMSEKDREILGGENLKIGLPSVASRKTLAKFIVGEIISPRFQKQSVFVKNASNS